MNLFQQYGIKEVADVVFYSINSVGDEEYYTPVLYLDTLKVSTLEEKAEKVSINGGYGNEKLMAWSFGKEITLNLEDALFSPASMSLMWGGQLEAKFSKYTSAITKINMANKYGKLNYSIKAYPSPALTDQEWEIIYSACDKAGVSLVVINDDTPAQCNFIMSNEEYIKNSPYIEENRTLLKKAYYQRDFDKIFNKAQKDNILTEWIHSDERINIAIPDIIVSTLISMLNTLDKFGTIETAVHNVEVIDRMEKCIVRDKEGFTINTSEQRKNLLKYYKDDQNSSYIIYYDAKTLLPLLNINNNGEIVGWDKESDNFEPGTGKPFQQESGDFKLRIGTRYLKWSRTVKRKNEDDGILGKTLVINADTFPNIYKIVGETYIREQKTGKDQRYQFVINRAQISSDTNLTLEAEGEPTTFSMQIDVLTPPNNIMMELKQYDVDEDLVHGGMRIIPYKGQYTHTATTNISKIDVPYDNIEIY